MYKVVRGVVRGTADAAHIVMNFPNVLKKIVISILGEGSSIFMHQYFLRDFYTIFHINSFFWNKNVLPRKCTLKLVY